MTSVRQDLTQAKQTETQDFMQAATLSDEIRPIVENGICVGCGACAIAADGAITMKRMPNGAYSAKIVNEEIARQIPGGVCPFSNIPPNEDEHSDTLFATTPHTDVALGRFQSTWAGFCTEDGLREGGSSGGLTTWLVAEALSQGIVDAVVHVHPSDGDELFQYSVSRNKSEVCAGSKTRYYSVSFTEALKEISRTGERIALVGVPCFIKAARNLALRDNQLRNQLTLTVALVCGHMKTAAFAESLAWQIGIPPKHVTDVDFRVKVEGLPASQYGFSAKNKLTSSYESSLMGDLAGRRWDGGYHRMKACDYCDDVFGETADVTFGDAWLPEFSKDPDGTNVIVVRTKLASDLLRNGIQRGALDLTALDPDRAVASQAGGLRDRREGLAYRLHLDALADKWAPTKRVPPSAGDLNFYRKFNYRLRRIVRDRSASSFKMCKKLGFLWPYKVEMTFWHACFRALQILEKKLGKK